MNTLLAALVVCSTATPVQQCNETTARHVAISDNGYSMPWQCALEAQSYAAEKHLVSGREYLKVFCGPAKKILNRFGTI